MKKQENGGELPHNRHIFFIYFGFRKKKIKKTFGYIKFLLYFCRNL